MFLVHGFGGFESVFTEDALFNRANLVRVVLFIDLLDQDSDIDEFLLDKYFFLDLVTFQGNSDKSLKHAHFGGCVRFTSRLVFFAAAEETTAGSTRLPSSQLIAIELTWSGHDSLFFL